MEKERRTVTTTFELRELGEEKTTVLEGYALKFNKPSENLGYFIEELDEKCLDGTDMSNVVALYNHDPNYPLARNTVSDGEGSLKLSVDGLGLKFTITPTDTSYVRDLVRNMQSGVVNQCSFAFTLADDGDEWSFNEDTRIYHRLVKNIERLWDVSIVTTPAYPDTEAVASERTLERGKAQLGKSNDMVQEMRKRKILLDVE